MHELNCEARRREESAIFTDSARTIHHFRLAQAALQAADERAVGLVLALHARKLLAERQQLCAQTLDLPIFLGQGALVRLSLQNAY